MNKTIGQLNFEPQSYLTHTVSNQSSPLENYNRYTSDQALQEAVEREGAGWAKADLVTIGEMLGRSEAIELGILANRYPPELRTHDRFGNRCDSIEFHPAWHRLLALACNYGLQCSPWQERRAGGQVARAAAYLMYAQVENGTQCPLTMTFAAIPVLRRYVHTLPELESLWLPRLLSRRYDRHFLPISKKSGALIGMGMTEKQGGSDLRAIITRAEPVGASGPGAKYRITGHKWFFSAPMCDAFLVLAQTAGGVSCIFLPRWLPDGSLNAIRLQRLKDKLGDRANASSEVEFQGATGWLLGEEGRGLPIILEMSTYTRLDCAIGSAGMMRFATAQALYHASQREAFGQCLTELPLMQNVLADLAVESEAATVAVLRLARAYDYLHKENEAALSRLLTPAVKYWVCKRGPVLAAEAMEVLGGNGYIEDSVMPRLYRQLPLNSIWEGAGNIMCVDVLRAINKMPETIEALLAELKLARGGDTRLDQFIVRLMAELSDTSDMEIRGRRLTECITLAFQGALLVRFAPDAVSEAFCASRLAGDWSGAFGNLPVGIDVKAIIARAYPALTPSSSGIHVEQDEGATAVKAG